MKFLKVIALSATALALASVASAATVKVTGSTAFRKALYVSIINNLASAPGKSLSSVKVAWFGNATMTSAPQVIFSNGTDTVQACMAGSVGGVNWVVTGTNVATVAPFDPTYTAKTATAWLAAGNLPGAGNVTSVGAGPNFDVTLSTSVLAAPSWEAAATADFTMSDSLQASTPFSAASSGVTLVNAGSANLGVVQFVFAKGDAGGIGGAADARLTNMSSLAFRDLATNGFVFLSALTGNASDDSALVLLTGRDSDSGTRLATAFETGYGDVQSPMSQWKAFSSANADLGSAAGTIGYVSSISGQAGYSSGGNVKNVLSSTVTAGSTLEQGGSPASFILLGYVGIADVPTAAGRVLTYNGVAQSTAATQNGQYTFWTHEQAYYKSTLASDKKAIADAIANGIKNSTAPASGGVLESTMKADRASEGAVVFRTL